MQDPIDNSTVYWRVILGKYSNYYYYYYYAIRTQEAQTSKLIWFYKEIVYLNIAKEEPITSVFIDWNTFNPFPVRLIGSFRPVGN